MKALFQTFSTHFSIIKLFESRLFPWFEKFMNKFSDTFMVHWKLLQPKAIVLQQQNKTEALYMSIIIRKYVCSKYESNNFQLTKMIFSQELHKNQIFLPFLANFLTNPDTALLFQYLPLWYIQLLKWICSKVLIRYTKTEKQIIWWFGYVKSVAKLQKEQLHWCTL